MFKTIGHWFCSDSKSFEEDIWKAFIGDRTPVNALETSYAFSGGLFCKKKQNAKDLLLRIIKDWNYNFDSSCIDYIRRRGAKLDDPLPDGTYPILIAKDEDLIEILIERKVRLNVTDNSGRNILHYWVVNKKLEWISKFEEKIQDLINIKDNSGDTPLHLAAINCNMDLLNKLIDLGADVNATNNKQDTPLHVAAENSRPNVIDLLLSKGADINQQNEKGDTAFHILINEEEKPVVNVIKYFKQGLDPTIQNNSGISLIRILNRKKRLQTIIYYFKEHPDYKYATDLSSFHIYKSFGAKELEFFIERGADPQKYRVNGELNPIWYYLFTDKSRSIESRFDIVRLLIKHGVSIMVYRSKNGKPLLGKLINRHYFDIADSLLEDGLFDFKKTRKMSYWNESYMLDLFQSVSLSMMIAVNTKDKLRMSDVEKYFTSMLSHGAELNQDSEFGALEIYSGFNDPSFVETLMSLGMEPKDYHKSKLFFSPISFAIKEDCIKMFKYWYDKFNYSIDERNANNQSFLHLAGIFNSPKIAKYLIEAGANVNLQDIFGETPLTKAVRQWGTDSITEMLLRNHADPRIKNKKGFTPIDIAKDDHQKILAKFGFITLKQSSDDSDSSWSPPPKKKKENPTFGLKIQTKYKDTDGRCQWLDGKNSGYCRFRTVDHSCYCKYHKCRIEGCANRRIGQYDDKYHNSFLNRPVSDFCAMHDKIGKQLLRH